MCKPHGTADRVTASHRLALCACPYRLRANARTQDAHFSHVEWIQPRLQPDNICRTSDSIKRSNAVEWWAGSGNSCCHAILHKMASDLPVWSLYLTITGEPLLSSPPPAVLPVSMLYHSRAIQVCEVIITYFSDECRINQFTPSNSNDVRRRVKKSRSRIIALYEHTDTFNSIQFIF